MTGRSNLDTILLAAELLERAGTIPYTTEQLTVAVWEQDRTAFGLKGFEDIHPDNHRILSALSGDRGLVGRKFLDRVGKGLFQLTQQGAEELKRIKAGQPITKTVWRALTPKAMRHLTYLLQTTAWSRWRQKMRDHISYEDAELFILGGDLSDTIGQLETMTANGPVKLTSGQEVDASLPKMLRECEQGLMRMFFRKLGKVAP